MLHDSDERIHEDGKKGERLASVLQHYNLISETELSDLFKIVCPLHEDINASMQIDLSKGIYYCYGCGKSGEAVDLVREIEQADGLRAYILLERVLKGNLKRKVRITKTVQETPEFLLKQAKLYFYSLQKPSWRYIHDSYMHKRGFDSKTLAKVDVRLNSNSDYGVAMPMQEMGVFKGYVLRATSEGANQNRKYLYNKGFSRRNTLVGDYASDLVIVVEGYMDWLRFVQFGKINCVAILGWKATEQQIAKIKHYTNTVISALDNTETGRKGTTYLREKGFDVIRFRFPANVKDPGEMDATDFNKAWLDTMRVVNKQRSKKANG